MGSGAGPARDLDPARRVGDDLTKGVELGDVDMVERVANRLWLVKDNRVQDFDGDLEDYRKFTIESRRNQKRSA